MKNWAISYGGGSNISYMFERLNEQENIGATARPPRKMQSESDHVHRAVFSRTGQLREERPGAQITEELQDQEPRAILKVVESGRPVRVEFIESMFSADQLRFLEEYVQAARQSGELAVLYPGQSFPEEYVLRVVQIIFERIRFAGVKGEVSVHGFLYDFEGFPREIV